ncbi:hypothetical protein J6590_106554, partial [Homalodisca vitripennis]
KCPWPLERVWVELKRRVRTRQPTPSTMAQLEAAVTEQWNNVPKHRFNISSKEWEDVCRPS